MTKQKHLIKSFFLTLTPLSLNDCLISPMNQASLASFFFPPMTIGRQCLATHLPLQRRTSDAVCGVLDSFSRDFSSVIRQLTVLQVPGSGATVTSPAGQLFQGSEGVLPAGQKGGREGGRPSTKNDKSLWVMSKPHLLFWGTQVLRLSGGAYPKTRTKERRTIQQFQQKEIRVLWWRQQVFAQAGAAAVISGLPSTAITGVGWVLMQAGPFCSYLETMAKPMAMGEALVC